MILSLFSNSFKIFPGRTLSGQYDTNTSGFFGLLFEAFGKERSGLSFESQVTILSVVPTGEVDSKIIKLFFSRTSEIENIDFLM